MDQSHTQNKTQYVIAILLENIEGAALSSLKAFFIQMRAVDFDISLMGSNIG